MELFRCCFPVPPRGCGAARPSPGLCAGANAARIAPDVPRRTRSSVREPGAGVRGGPRERPRPSADLRTAPKPAAAGGFPPAPLGARGAAARPCPALTSPHGSAESRPRYGARGGVLEVYTCRAAHRAPYAAVSARVCRLTTEVCIPATGRCAAGTPLGRAAAPGRGGGRGREVGARRDGQRSAAQSRTQHRAQHRSMSRRRRGGGAGAALSDRRAGM